MTSSPPGPTPTGSFPGPGSGDGPRISPAIHIMAIVFVAATVSLSVLALAALESVVRGTPEIEPRHRPEALCFLLAQPPPFVPPMTIQPSAALVRGRFVGSMPAAYALRQQMQLEEEMVLREWTHRVADYDVTLFWLQLDERETTHWLVATWMEGTDLAVCNFRFSGKTRALSSEERVWGVRLLRRILQPENFRRGVLPDVKLKPREGATMPRFGPAT
jgi:hypothetical protein